MRKCIYFFLAFLFIYITIFLGRLLAAFFFYQENGYFILNEHDFLSPIKPAVIALIIQLFVANLLPSKNNNSKEDK